ncbi:acyltransferase, partial [Butyricicoccus sp. 1XD8-22]
MHDLQAPTKKFRPEIEGVRVVASLLVAVYHIWLGRVSGGVDVFFIVSGFLITTSLLSRMEKVGRIHLLEN